MTREKLERLSSFAEYTRTNNLEDNQESFAQFSEELSLHRESLARQMGITVIELHNIRGIND